MNSPRLLTVVASLLLAHAPAHVIGADAMLQTTRRAADRPNILVILVDDLGYGDLSCYGATDLKTPNIDALVAAGMRLDRFYANCPVCSPTRAALLSGRYPDLVGVPGVIRTHSPPASWGYLRPDAVLLPAVLKKAGYHTAAVGKWHLGDEPENLPNARGFDYFHGFLGDMMSDYYTHRRAGRNYMRLNDQVIDPQGHATDLFTQWAVQYITERAGTSDGSARPWFLYLAYNAPHIPIQPPKSWLEKVRRSRPGLDPQRARLVALIEHLDHGIGQVVAALHRTGQAGRTLVIFTSDNGGQVSVGASNGPLNGTKGQMLEGGIRVPFCAVWPGHIRPGSRSDVMAMTMDIYPLVCQAAGAAFDHAIDGVSFLPTLLGGEQPELNQRTLFWVRREGGRDMGLAFYAVRRGPWKLLQNRPFEPFALYNLDQDPREQQDLSASHRKQFEQLAVALRAHIQQAGAVPWQKPVTGR